MNQKSDGLDPAAKLENLPENSAMWTESKDIKAIKRVLVNGAMEQLSKAQREAFQLVVIEGKTEDIAALMMNVRRSSIRTHVKRAGERLRKIIERDLSPMPDDVKVNLHRVKPTNSEDYGDE